MKVDILLEFKDYFLSLSPWNQIEFPISCEVFNFFNILLKIPLFTIIPIKKKKKVNEDREIEIMKWEVLSKFKTSDKNWETS